MIISSLATTGISLQIVLEAIGFLFYIAYLPFILYWLYRQFLIHRSPLWKAAPIALLIFIGSDLLLFLWDQLGYWLFSVLLPSAESYSNYQITSIIMGFILEVSYLIFTILLVVIAIKKRKSQSV